MRPSCVNWVGPQPSVLSDTQRTHTWEENGGRPRDTAVRQLQAKGRLGTPGAPTSGRGRKAPHAHPEHFQTPGLREHTSASQPPRPRGSATAAPGPRPPPSSAPPAGLAQDVQAAPAHGGPLGSNFLSQLLLTSAS